METSTAIIYNYLEQTYPKDGLLYNSLDEEDKNILEISILCLKKSINPKAVLTDQAFNRLIEFTGIHFELIPVDEFTSLETLDAPSSFIISLHTINNKQESPKVETQDNLKSISCKSYSCGSNLSQNYQFANNVNFATCANSNVPGMYCMYAIAQHECPFNSPDITEYATYNLINDKTIYNYSVTKYRHIYGDTLFHIYDQDKNLLNELSFTPEVYSSIKPEDLSNEIKSIVTEIHRNIFYKDEFSLTQSNSQDLITTIPTKSYIATLIP